MPYRRILKFLPLAIAAVLPAAPPSWAANVNVTATPSLSFSPATVTINAGDTVTWHNGGGFHNVHADDNGFRCANGCEDAGGNGAADDNDWVAVRAFNQPGTYRYYCDIHGAPGGIGMSGTVVVRGAGGAPPDAPSNLQAAARSTTEVTLTWTDNSNNETGFRIERRTVDGAYQEVATVGPNASGTASAIVGGLEPSTFYLFRVRAVGGTATSAFSNEAGVATLGVIVLCASGPETLCLNNGRFKVQMDWRIPDGTTGTGKAVPLPSAPASGLFFFFGPDNVEMLLKVLNACVPPFNRYWVFFAATTNVEFAVVVTDTQTGKTKGYFNPLGRSALPVQDVDAFATCP